MQQLKPLWTLVFMPSLVVLEQDMVSDLGAGLWLFLTAPSLTVAREELE